MCMVTIMSHVYGGHAPAVPVARRQWKVVTSRVDEPRTFLILRPLDLNVVMFVCILYVCTC